MGQSKQKELDLDQLDSHAPAIPEKSAKELKQEKAAAEKLIQQEKARAAKEKKAAEAQAKKLNQDSAIKPDKPSKPPKASKPVSAGKLPSKTGKLLGVLGLVFILLGTLFCIATVQALANKEELTSVEAATLTELRKSVEALQTQLESFSVVDESLIQAINRETRVSDSVQDKITAVAEQSGMIVHKTSMLEKRNEADVLKAYYVLEGAAQTNNIVSFLEQIQTQDSVMLFDEVSLLEGTRVSVGLNSESASETTLVKEFRIVLQHAYDASGLVDTPVTQAPNTAAPSGEIPIQPTHTHTFENRGWKQPPTEMDVGYEVELCTTCNEVNMITVPASADYHAWSSGACGGRSCTVCDKSEGDKPTHFMSPWSDLTDSTCYVAGAKERRCVVAGCEHKEATIIEKKPHKYVLKDDKQICQVCGMPQTADLGITIE